MNLRAEAKSETSIGLSWSAPRQESVIKYELLFREGDRGREVPGPGGWEGTAGVGHPRGPPWPPVSTGSSLTPASPSLLPTLPTSPLSRVSLTFPLRPPLLMDSVSLHHHCPPTLRPSTHSHSPFSGGPHLRPNHGLCGGGPQAQHGVCVPAGGALAAGPGRLHRGRAPAHAAGQYVSLGALSLGRGAAVATDTARAPGWGRGCLPPGLPQPWPCLPAVPQFPQSRAGLPMEVRPALNGHPATGSSYSPWTWNRSCPQNVPTGPQGCPPRRPRMTVRSPSALLTS